MKNRTTFLGVSLVFALVAIFAMAGSSMAQIATSMHDLSSTGPGGYNLTLSSVCQPAITP